MSLASSLMRLEAVSDPNDLGCLPEEELNARILDFLRRDVHDPTLSVETKRDIVASIADIEAGQKRYDADRIPRFQRMIASLRL